MREKTTTSSQALAAEIAKDCRTVDDIQTAIRVLFKDAVEAVLQAEMDEHLGYSKHSVEGNNSGNSRNGVNKKEIKTNYGVTELSVPRDRNGEFEPQIIKIYERTSNGIEELVVSMYAKGMSTRDIEDHLKAMYGIDVSPTLVSRITDKIMPQIVEWQARPLDPVYPIIYLDAIHFKVRKENLVVNKAA